MPQRHEGFSLVEIMVGMTVGLLGMIVIMQVASVSETTKRTTTSGGDAQQNGALSLHTLERDIRQAGYGVNIAGLLGCAVNGFDETPPGRDFIFTLAPVVITQGVGNAPDTITATYGNASKLAVPASLVVNMSTPTEYYKVNNRYGFTVGDLVIAAESGKSCSLAEVTSLPTATSDRVLHDSGTYTDSTGATVSSRYNKPGGLGVSYTTLGKLYDIGPLPVNNSYSIVGNSLVVQSNMTGASDTIAEGIVDLQAEYGIDTDNDRIVDSYRTSADLDGSGTVSDAEWGSVLSVRVGLVARSNKREPACNVTAAVPTWKGGAFSNVTANPEWQCYRYRVYETTVMLRNMIWRPT